VKVGLTVRLGPVPGKPLPTTVHSKPSAEENEKRQKAKGKTNKHITHVKKQDFPNPSLLDSAPLGVTTCTIVVQYASSVILILEKRTKTAFCVFLSALFISSTAGRILLLARPKDIYMFHLAPRQGSSPASKSTAIATESKT
jgi:hypothetical protein